MSEEPIYIPLNPTLSTSQIRVVDLLPGPSTSDEEESICLELRVVELESSPTPPFEALSYTWGDANSRKPVLLNGRVHNVTTNLRCALGYLRLANQRRTLWIDALCINQADIAEQNREVPRMRDIYSKADRVIVWLGGYDSLTRAEIDECFEHCHEIAMIEHEDDAHRHATSIPNYQDRVYRPLISLLERQWFERIWIVQEVVLRHLQSDDDDSIMFVCGSSTIPYPVLIIAHNKLREHFDQDNRNPGYGMLINTPNGWVTHLGEQPAPEDAIRLELRQRSNVASIHYIRKVFWSANDGNLLEPSVTSEQSLLQALRCTSSRFKATDPRDRVYGLLGLVKLPSDIPPSILPDYERDVYLVIAGAACYILQGVKNEWDLLEHVPKDEVKVWGYMTANYVDLLDANLQIDDRSNSFTLDPSYFGEVVWTNNMCYLGVRPKVLQEEHIIRTFQAQILNIRRQSASFAEQHSNMPGFINLPKCWAHCLYHHFIKQFRCKEPQTSEFLDSLVSVVMDSFDIEDFVAIEKFVDSIFLWLMITVLGGSKTVFVTNLGFVGCCDGFFVPDGALVCRFFGGPPGKPYVILVRHENTSFRIAYDVHYLMHLAKCERWSTIAPDGVRREYKLKGATIDWEPREKELLERTSTSEIPKHLGDLWAEDNELAETEKIYQRRLHGYEKTLGPNHTTTLETIHNLSILWMKQGKLDKAEKMYQRALAGYEETLGPEHISTLHTVNNFGILFMQQGKLDQAIEICQRVLEGYKKVLGPDHTLTTNAVNGLGSLYLDQCYTAIHESTSGGLLNIVPLVELCIRYISYKRILLQGLVRAFVWIGEETLSLLAFSYQVSDTPSDYHAGCDACACHLGSNTGRFACRSCKDVDLCKSCFESYQVGELKELVETCEEHTFLELTFLAENHSLQSDRSVDLERWLQELLASDLISE